MRDGMGKLRSFLGAVLLAMLIMACIAGGVFAYEGYDDPIRVQIGKASTADVSVSYGTYQVIDNEGQIVSTISSGNSASLTEGMKLSAVSADGRFLWNGTEYRGDFALISGDAVNTLGMELYLYSVVMQELGGYAPDVEALKAQAVACRNFAYRRLENPRTSTYDILSGTSDQAYGGYTGERFDTVIGERVRDAQLPRMQHLPRRRNHPRPSVKRIPQHRTAHIGHMHPDLMGSARLKKEADSSHALL